MRLFIAVNIPGELKDNIEAVQNDLKRSRADVKWVEKENFHLTVKFIGDTDSGTPALLESNLSQSLKDFGSFIVSLCGAGAFPSASYPRVVWIGIGDGAEKLKQLAAKTEDAAFELGFPREKRGFSPHLTIGRVKSPSNKEFLEKKIILQEKCSPGSFEVKKVDVMESVLLPQGPEYKCISSIFI
ncbi:MAG: RNA 2',3'-cyclic phosphodiesterase [Elusimicrobiota bacterium]